MNDFNEMNTSALERMAKRLEEDLEFCQDHQTKHHLGKMFLAINSELDIRRAGRQFPGMKAAIALWSAGKTF